MEKFKTLADAVALADQERLQAKYARAKELLNYA